MAVCEECGDKITRTEAKGYSPDGPVHVACFPAAELACGDCNLIHRGTCY